MGIKLSTEAIQINIMYLDGTEKCFFKLSMIILRLFPSVKQSQLESAVQ